jgi:iron complex transport system substrate-binding protein
MVKLQLVAVTAAVALLAAPVGEGGTAATKPKPFPVTVQAKNGNVRIAKRPTRIVSLSPTATEMLYAVGAGRQVVAVDSLSNYPARAPRTSLSGFQPNVEAIAGYRPDLVVGDLSAGVVAELRALRVPVLVYEAPRQFSGSYTQITQIGRATGHRVQAARAVRSMRARIADAVADARRAGSRRLSVFHELTPDLYSVTSRTFVGQVYRLLGLRNIADAADVAGSGYPQLSSEAVIAANPDVIVLADSKCCAQSARTVAARPGWSTIAAVRNRRVVSVDDDIASRWGPRIATFIRVVANAVARR